MTPDELWRDDTDAKTPETLILRMTVQETDLEIPLAIPTTSPTHHGTTDIIAHSNQTSVNISQPRLTIDATTPYLPNTQKKTLY